MCVGDEISNFKYVTMKKAMYGICFLALVGCTRSVRDKVEIPEIQFKSNVRESRLLPGRVFRRMIK